MPRTPITRRWPRSAPTSCCRGARRGRRRFGPLPEGLDGLVDGGVYGEAALPAVTDGGAIAVVRSNPPVPSQRGIHIDVVQMTDYYRDAAKPGQLAEAAAAGQLTMRVATVLDPSDAGAAHMMLAAGGTRGRIVLDFSGATAT
ncbi:zinc-binding dehydrogenase [Aeromicrobium sp. UC242_57]|uniref:zinc-binding dehydrogenase n=1 Tax=Aeromicrobium sp. UC242_57 TaxID=3374624 RepID=UPI0037A4B0A0